VKNLNLNSEGKILNYFKRYVIGDKYAESFLNQDEVALNINSSKFRNIVKLRLITYWIEENINTQVLKTHNYLNFIYFDRAAKNYDGCFTKT